MKQDEIKNASTAELKEAMIDIRNSYSDLKMAHTISPLENPIQLRTKREVQ